MAIKAFCGVCKHLTIFFGFAFCALPTLLLGQGERDQPRAFKVKVLSVPVDVVATEKNGAPVLDLGRDDFEIWEDGQRQKLDFIGLQSYEDPTRSRQGPATGPVDASRTVSDAPYRAFLLFLGRGRQTEFNFLNKLGRFVETGLLPSDRVALMAYGRATDFTTDHAAVREVLRRFEVVQEEIEATLELRGQQTTPLYSQVAQMPERLRAKVEAVFASAGLSSREVLARRDVALDEELEALSQEVSAREAKSGLSDTRQGLGILVSQGSEASAASAGAPFTSDGRLPADFLFREYIESRAKSEDDISGLYSAIEYLRFVEGEKHLIFMSSEGLFLPRVEAGDSIAAMAGDSRVRVHCLRTAGTRPVVDLGLEESIPWDINPHGRFRKSLNQSVERSFAMRSIAALAELSGGFAPLREEPLEGLKQIERATRSVYLLAFEPNDRKEPGYRRIEVRVKRRGVMLSYRNGYYARDKDGPSGLREMRSYARVVSALTHPEPVHDFAAEVEIQGLTMGKDETRFTTAVRMYFDERMVEKGTGKYTCPLVYTAFFLSPELEPISDIWDTLRLDLSEATFRRFCRTGLSFRRKVQVPARLKGGWIKLVLYDPIGDRLASVIQKLE